MSDSKLKITYENHGETRIVELPWDSSLPKIVLSIMQMLEASGWSREQIAELFGDSEQSIWEWEV